VARGWRVVTHDCEINIFCDVIFEERNPLALFKRGENIANEFGRDHLISAVDAWESGRRLFYILVAVEKRLGIKPVKVWRWSHDQLRSSWQFHDAELIGAGNCTGVSQYGISVGI